LPFNGLPRDIGGRLKLAGRTGPPRFMDDGSVETYFAFDAPLALRIGDGFACADPTEAGRDGWAGGKYCASGFKCTAAGSWGGFCCL